MAETDKLRAALQRIDAWFAQHRPRFFQGLNPGAADAELAGLPEELRVFLSWHNGQSGDFVGCFEEHWFLLGAAEIRAAEVGIKGWFAILDDDAGNCLCIDTTQAPAPLYALYLDDTTPGMVARTLTAWMTAFADGLEAGCYVEDSERGTLMRQRS